MKLRPPPPPPSRIINDLHGETQESIIKRLLWEEDMKKWDQESKQFKESIERADKEE